MSWSGDGLPARRGVLGRAALAAVAGAVVLYFLAVARLAVDFPYWDDYYSVLQSLSKFHAGDTWGEKLSVLVSQHNEHRIPFLRAVALGCCAVEGRVDFRVLIWIGNAGLVGLCAAMAAGARRSVAAGSVLALIPLALVSPIQERQMIWVSASLSNFWVLAFAAGALLLVNARKRVVFGLACGLGVVASFTSGQGILCFVAGGVMLALERRWRRAAAWLVIMAVTAVVYFKGYARPSYHPPPEFSWRAMEFFPVVVGGAVSDLTCRLLAPMFEVLGMEAALVPTVRTGAGVVLVGLAALLWARRYYERNLFLSGFLLYLLLLCATASVSRSGFGLQQALMSHYKVISAAIAVVVAVALLDLRYGGRGAGWPETAILVGGVQLSVVSWCLFYPSVKGFSAELADGRERFLRGQDSRGVMRLSLRSQGVDILWQSYLSGLMRLEELDAGAGSRLSPERLSRIAVREGSEDIDPGRASGRVVARLRWAGEELLVSPVVTPAGLSGGGGRIWFWRGRLHYVLPVHGSSGSPQIEP